MLTMFRRSNVFDMELVCIMIITYHDGDNLELYANCSPLIGADGYK